MAEMSREEVIARLQERIDGCDRALKYWAAYVPDAELQRAIDQTTKDREAYETAIALLSQQEQEKQGEMVSIPLDTAKEVHSNMVLAEWDFAKAIRKAKRKGETSEVELLERRIKAIRDASDTLQKAIGRK